MGGDEHDKSGGGAAGHGAKSTAKKHPLPHGQHEAPSYGTGNMWLPEDRGHPFWHPTPKDLPEPPIHFQKNAVSLELHLSEPRQRLAGMTDAERAWRKKFVLDQHLAPEEPVYVPQYFGNFNPFRRIYRFPWDTLERRVLIPAMGYTYGHYTRMTVPKVMIAGVLLMWMYYNGKYYHPTWMDRYRMRFIGTDRLLREEEIQAKAPGLIEKGTKQFLKKEDYFDLDFKNRWTHLNLDPPLRP